jgi:hypothetical protein
MAKEHGIRGYLKKIKKSHNLVPVLVEVDIGAAHPFTCTLRL